MPLRPDLRNLRDENGELVYRGPAWKARRERLLERCGNKCERCRKPNHETVETVTGQGRMIWRPFLPFAASGCRAYWRDGSGRSITRLAKPRLVFGTGERAIRVVLTMAHLDHNPLNNADSNLAMLCQWCHLNYDRLHHRDTRCERKDAARPLLRGAA